MKMCLTAGRINLKRKMVTTKTAKLPENQGVVTIGPNTRKVDLTNYPTL
jgi:hypothetical protein